MRKVPISIMVLSIIGLVLGAINALGLLILLVMQFAKLGRPDPAMEALTKDMIYRVYSAVSLWMSIPVLILLVAGCIGSLMLRPWARKCMNIYAWFFIVQIVIASIYTFTYLIPKMSAVITAGTPAVARAGVNIGMYVGACFNILMLAFPICILYFYSRPHVLDAFNGIFPASPTNFPVEFPPQSP